MSCDHVQITLATVASLVVAVVVRRMTMGGFVDTGTEAWQRGSPYTPTVVSVKPIWIAASVAPSAA